jgi:hypothetical protein
MKRRFSRERVVSVAGWLMLVAAGCRHSVAEAPAAAVSSFNIYIAALESRLDRQHGSVQEFLADADARPETDAKLRRGELVIEELTPPGGKELPGTLLHHWRGTAFTPGATAADFERLMRDFSDYPQHFAPQVMRASVTAEQGGRVQAVMRVRQKHVITVVMDTAYDVSFGRLDAQHRYSISRSTRIAEIEAPETATERVMTAKEEHGFLWRLNTYWSCEERDGGLYMQVESVTLTRAIPAGLGRAVRPFVESVPRDSLEFTLRSTRAALRK